MANASKKPTVVACPNCGTEQVWDTFCSARCKNNDLVAWANEDHAIPGQPLEDVFSEDLEGGY